MIPCSRTLSSPSSPLLGSVALFKVRTPPRCLSATTKTQTAAQLLSSRQSILDKTKNENKNKHSVNQPITFTQYCLHHTIRYGYSANPTRAHCLPHTSCWLDVCFENRMTRLVLLTKSISDVYKRKKNQQTNNVSTASTENQVICQTDTAVIQKRQVAGSVYWFRYFYAKLVGLFFFFLRQSSYSTCPWICCDSVVPAGGGLHRRSSWLSYWGIVTVPVLFGIQVNSNICNSCLYSLRGAIPIVFILARYLKKKKVLPA